MLSGLHNSLKDSYLNSDKTIRSLGGNECFYIREKAPDYFELKLPSGWYVTLPRALARAMGYLNHKYQLPTKYQRPVSNQEVFLGSQLLQRQTTARTSVRCLWRLLFLSFTSSSA